jgi:CheY-like chemotaxis protein
VHKDSDLAKSEVGTPADAWRPPAQVDPVGSARADAEYRADAAGPLAPLTILVVDDDALICAGTAAMLEDLGHTVIQANAGEEALDLLGTNQRIDVVVTDYAMPGMNGPDLAARVVASFPDMPVILATGYAEPPAGDGDSLALP